MCPSGTFFEVTKPKRDISNKLNGNPVILLQKYPDATMAIQKETNKVP